MKLNCIAVDDDPNNLEVISEYLSKFDNYRLLKTFTDPIKALEFLNQQEKTDYLFMDVEMPQMSGLELSTLIRDKAEYLIFTTAHAQYALDAFDIRADAFLLKPYSFSRFAQVLSGLSVKRLISIKNPEGFFFIKNRNEKSKLVKIRYDEIIAIESVQNYITIYTPEKTVVAHLTLSKIKDILKPWQCFVQIHRCFIISKHHIEEIDNNLVRMKNNIWITIGENYKNELNHFIGTNTIKTGSRV